jgi:transcription elongation factor GreA
MAVAVPPPHDRHRLVPDREERNVNVRTNDDERVLITAEGYEQRCRELERLRNEERRRLAGLLREARGDGDVEDNPTLLDLLGEQARLEERIATLEEQLAAAEVAPPPCDDRAAIGSLVRVRDAGVGDVFECELVGPLEGDATNGRVSVAAPIGRALLGQSRGAQIEVATPRGTVALEVIEVRAPSAPLAKEAA